MPKLNDNKVLNEILESEKNYKGKIKTLVNFLSGPNFGTVLNDLKTNLDSLHGSSKKIIKNIEDTLAMLDNDSVSEFERFNIGMERLLLMDAFYTQYGSYVSVFNALQEILQNAEGDFKEIDKCLAAQNRGMGLEYFAIEPIQRAMRYELLLKELLKSSQEENSIDERQGIIIKALYEKAKEKNTSVNMQQHTQEDDIGYRFGDIIGGKYQLGDITRRIQFTLWGKSKAKDDTIKFEILEDTSSASAVDSLNNA